jgi:hypothetical protein
MLVSNLVNSRRAIPLILRKICWAFNRFFRKNYQTISRKMVFRMLRILLNNANLRTNGV